MTVVLLLLCTYVTLCNDCMCTSRRLSIAVSCVPNSSQTKSLQFVWLHGTISDEALILEKIASQFYGCPHTTCNVLLGWLKWDAAPMRLTSFTNIYPTYKSWEFSLWNKTISHTHLPKFLPVNSDMDQSDWRMSRPCVYLWVETLILPA